MGVGTGQWGGRRGRRDRERRAGTVASPGASLGPGHTNTDLVGRGWSNEGQSGHQALSIIQAVQECLQQPCSVQSSSILPAQPGVLPVDPPAQPTRAPPHSHFLSTQRKSFSGLPTSNHSLPDHPVAPAYFPLQMFTVLSLQGPDQATEKECCLPIFFLKYLEVWVGGGRHGMWAKGVSSLWRKGRMK